MRSYVVRALFGPGAAVVVVVVLCWGWLVYDSVGQVDDGAEVAALTVRQCIGVNATTTGPLEEALIKEGIIEEDLLQTKVTNSMCKDMLEPIADGTPLQKLAAAQSYIQEIKLIEGAMREAAGEAAAKGTDRYASSDKPSIRFRAVAQTSEQVGAAQAQYEEPGGGGAGDDGTGGDGTGVVVPGVRQAAAAASVGEDNDVSIAERLRQKEAAATDAGASVPEARAGARCGTEVEVSDEEIKKAAKKSEEGLYEIIPQIPKEIRLRETERAGLLVSPVTKKKLQEISQKHEAIDEVSKSTLGCVVLTNRMKAEFLTLDLDALGVDRLHPDDIQELSSHRDTRWSWDINGRQAGNPKLWLDLSYEISREDPEFRLIPGSPVYEEPIRVRSPAPEPPWWQRTFGGIFERIFELFGA
jgi:hypothetical protein